MELLQNKNTPSVFVHIEYKKQEWYEKDTYSGAQAQPNITFPTIFVLSFPFFLRFSVQRY